MNRYQIWRADLVYDRKIAMMIRPASPLWAEYLAAVARGDTVDRLSAFGWYHGQVELTRDAKVLQVPNVTYNGKDYDIGAAPMRFFDMTATALQAGATLPANFSWVAVDGSTTAMDVPTFRDFYKTILIEELTRVYRLYRYAHQLHAALKTALDPSTVDITTGWPT